MTNSVPKVKVLALERVSRCAAASAAVAGRGPVLTRVVLPGLFGLLEDPKPDVRAAVSEALQACCGALGVQAVLEAGGSLPGARLDRLRKVVGKA